MSVPTLQQVIEEHNTNNLVARVIIGGTELPRWTSLNYSFGIGQTPVATIIVPGLANLPPAVKEEAAVQIWFGFRSGVSVLQKLVFGGGIVDSIGNNGAEITIECVMNGARKLQYSYNRRISYEFASVEASAAVEALLNLAGVANYSVNLPAWPIGTVVPQTIQFSTYGEAINKVAEVDGSPWYCLPTGQVRVEDRYPIPSPMARRTYFTGILTGPVETNPVGIENPDAKPRIEDIQRRTFRDQVANYIEVDGAVVTDLGPNGEQNSEQISETVSGLSGQFPNGAYWIPTPPLFQDFTFSNELIDTNAKAFEVAERYYNLKNRLFEEISISVPGDPDVFLGATVRVKDHGYSGTNSLYYVKGYSTSITESSCTTELQLTGGPESGTIGFATPFAEFTWTYDFTVTKSGPPGGPDNGIVLPPGTDIGAKLCEDLPTQVDTPDDDDEVDEDVDNIGPGTEGEAVVYIGLNGTHSQDFDGYIVSWVWTWTDHLDGEHTVNGSRWTLIVNPELQSSVEVTLTVTDNSGLTDSITKTVRTSVNYVDDPSNPDQPYDPTDGEEDTEEGGGVTVGPCSEPEFPCPYPPCDEEPVSCEGMERSYLVAAKSVAMASLDNRTWNDLTKAAADVVGDFISVDAGINNVTQTGIGIFGTSQGEIVRTIDNCETGTLVFTVPGNPRIECIHFDTEDMGEPGGDIPEPTETPTSSDDVPIYTQANPGTMTITQAYRQARLVGFSHDMAIIAVAVMKAESGLYSAASNTAGNSPPSEDRGIAQINDYYHPNVSDACAFNTQCAIQYMYTLSKGGSDFSPWSVYNGYSRYRDHLSAVQAEVGNLSGEAIAPSVPVGSVAPTSMKIWAGTSDGRIYSSKDSGKNWELHVDFGDGYPILQIGTPPRFGAQSSSLWAFGGDTADISTLVRIDPTKSGQFVSLDIQGELREEIFAAGAGAAVRSSMNETASILVFNNTVMSPSVRVWTSLDPLGDSSSWIACPVGTGTYNTVAPGFGGDFVIAGSTVMKTNDNENFIGLGAGPDTINHMIWRGLPGMYTAAMDDGVYQSVDFGDKFGALRPSVDFGTTWPAGAEAKQVVVSIGARQCEEPQPEACENAPRYEAAAGKEIGPEYFTNDQSLSAKIVGASGAVPDTALVTTFYEGEAGHKNLGEESGSGSSLQIIVEPTITDSYLFLAIVSRPGTAPSSVTDSQSLTWSLVQSTLSTDDIGNIRLSIYRANANAESILGLTVTIAFGTPQDVILAIVDEWTGLTATPGSDPVVNSDTGTNLDTTPVDFPDDYLLGYTFPNSSANFNQANLKPPSFGIALQLEQCGVGEGLLFVLQGSPSNDLVIASYIAGSWAEVARPAGVTSNGNIFNTFFTKLGNNHWLVSHDGATHYLYKSSDGGVTFSLKLTSTFGLPICQAANGTLWASTTDVGGTAKIRKSIDEGENWTDVYTITDSPFPLMESAAAHQTDENVIVFTGIEAAGSALPFVVVTTDGSNFTEFTLGSTSNPVSQYETLNARFLANGRFIFLAQVNAGSNGRVDGWWSDTPGNSGSYTAEIVGPVLTSNDYGCDALTAISPKGEPIFAVVSPCTLKGIRIFRSSDAENWTEIDVSGLPANFPSMAVFYDEPTDILYVWGFPGPSDNLWALADASGAATSWSQITGADTAIGETSAFAFGQMNITEI